ncbi:MAG: hypothetical protein ABFD50_10510 [Smithella sp.]
MKEKVKAYLLEKYTLTRWPFLSVIELQNEFGKEVYDVLSELEEEKVIRLREGMNFKLVEVQELNLKINTNE